MSVRSAAASLLVVLASCARELTAQTPGEPSSEVSPGNELATLEAPAAPELDGHLDESLWAMARPITAFHQEDPVEGALATEPTDVRAVLHGSTLYIGVVAYDSRSTDLVHRTLRRDALMELRTDGKLAFTGDDALALLIDADRDGRTAFLFATNPNGAEFDAQVSGEGSEVNISWRGVWSVAAIGRPDGWSAEFAIPLRTLRIGSASDGVLGFNVYRRISRKNEFVLWRSWRRESEGFLRVSRAGRLTGLGGASAGGWGLDVKPFATGGVRLGFRDDDEETQTELDGGLDLKYELRPGLVLDGTINADFAQAEVDDEQVNLTRFDLFLPEKREFFLENSGIFEFGTRVQGEIPPFQLFFSRRIGIYNGLLLPLRGGGRLSGRVRRQTVGLLHVVTGAVPSVPAASHSVVRVKRDVGMRGYAGAMLTRTTGDGSNEAGGIDFSVWPSASVNVSGFVARTTSPAGGAGHAFKAGVDYQVDRVGFTGQLLEIGPDLEAGLGFVPRTDIRRAEGLLRLSGRPGVLGVRRADLFLLAQGVTRTDGGFQDRVLGPALSLSWNSGDRMVVFLRAREAQLDAGFTVAGEVPVAAGRYDALDRSVQMMSNPARRLSAIVRALGQRDFDGNLLGVTGLGRLAVNDRVAMEVGVTHSRADLPGGSFATNVWSASGELAFSTRAVLSGRVQYNELDYRLTTTARLQWTYRSGSDLFVVFQDGMPDASDPTAQSGPAVIVKLTWLTRL